MNSNERVRKSKKLYPWVSCQPALEPVACLWTPEKRRAMARIYQQFAHELNVTAAVIEGHLQAPSQPRRLRFVRPERARLN